MSRELFRILEHREKDIKDLNERLRLLRIDMEEAIHDCELGYVNDVRDRLLRALKYEYEVMDKASHN